MEMEVVVAVPPAPVDFNFDSACSSPYMTAPSSPQRFGNFFLSAPTSPVRSSSFFRELNNGVSVRSSSSVPFDWEEKPGTPKARAIKNKIDNDCKDFDFIDDGDFEFDFSGQLDRTSLSADELFDGGKIRPLKPPPAYGSCVSSPRSPRSRNAQKKNEFDPFQAAIEATTRNKEAKQQQRGRDRTISSSSSTSKSLKYVHKGSRSLSPSPLRVSDVLDLDQEEINNSHDIDEIITQRTPPSSKTSYASYFLSVISFSSKTWKLKDLLLFRSASEGRATRNDPLMKYAALSKREAVEDVKTSSFRSTDGSVGGSSRRRGPVSAHELHYTANRAVAEEMKRKTFLPYKQGLLGCLGSNPSVHEISKGIGSLTRR